MKNQKLFSAFILMLGFTLCSFDCSSSNASEDDTSGPEVVVITPSEGAQYDIGNDDYSPASILVQASATDASKIELGSATFFNSQNQQLDYHDEIPSSFNELSVTSLYTSFQTFEEGNYRVEIEFTDELGNTTKVVRNITCVLDVGDNEAQ
ncbi:hypothetical protein [Pontimicrobium sp. IMCC45349]|jgi:hypothetical protein|uniref:hypothetical protein n=1 Tax=Pontimicrobium sp. IMCC45349 TaxID=3391574 RepID=UPI0039A10B99